MRKIEVKQLEAQGEVPISFLSDRVPAGFPSPAQGEHGDSIDLNKELIHRPSSTFCAKVAGDSMIDCGINDGDLLIIDKSINPSNGDIAVCFVDGEFTVKRLSVKDDGIYLKPANKKYQEVKVREDSNFQVWGVVSYIIKKLLQ